MKRSLKKIAALGGGGYRRISLGCALPNKSPRVLIPVRHRVTWASVPNPVEKKMLPPLPYQWSFIVLTTRTIPLRFAILSSRRPLPLQFRARRGLGNVMV